MAEHGPTDRPSPTPGVEHSAPAGARVPHRMRGFLFADLRDYTGYVEAHGDHAGAVLLERYQALVRAAVAAAAGAEVRTEGDSFYVVFDSASAAVACGLEILAAASTSGESEPVRVGVGVHAGETVETAGGFVGSAVNIAARLCGEAKAGELVVSETVRGLTRTYLDVAFEPLGPRRLKGIAEPVACYRVVARGAAPARPARARPSVGGRRPRFLAVGLGLAAVALVAVGAVLLGGGSAPTPTPTPSAAALASHSAAVSPSPGASAGGSTQPYAPNASPTLGPFPNEVEAAILAALPPTVAKTCRRGGTADDASLAGFKGKTTWPAYIDPTGRNGWPLNPGVDGYLHGGVTCTKLPTGADRLYVMDVAGRSAGPGELADLAAEFLGRLEGKYQIPVGSCATGQNAHALWTGPSGDGLVACMNPYEGRPWIYFTFGKGRYLGFATRDDSNYDALYAWFDQLKMFLP